MRSVDGSHSTAKSIRGEVLSLKVLLSVRERPVETVIGSATRHVGVAKVQSYTEGRSGFSN